jgi:hypothetical protein
VRGNITKKAIATEHRVKGNVTEESGRFHELKYRHGEELKVRHQTGLGEGVTGSLIVKDTERMHTYHVRDPCVRGRVD